MDFPSRSWLKTFQIRAVPIGQVGDLIELLPPGTLSWLVEGRTRSSGSCHQERKEPDSRVKI